MTDEQPMSEQPVQEPVPEPAAPEPATPEPIDPESIDPVKKPKKPLRRGRIAAVAGSVLLVAAVLGGAGYTVVTVQDADRD
ncbi:hypothetical protein ACFWIZ_07555, partial [Streptomyces sp. NPDC127044]